MTEHDSSRAGEPTPDELARAAATESYEGEPISDEELGRVWEAPSGDRSPSDDSSGDNPPADAPPGDNPPADAPPGDNPPAQEDPA